MPLPSLNWTPVATFDLPKLTPGEVIRPLRFSGVMLDTETGGLWETKHALTDIALVPFHIDLETQTYWHAQGATVAVRPFAGATFDHKALELRNVTQEWFYDRPDLLSEEEALLWVYRQLTNLLGAPEHRDDDARANWFGRVWGQNSPFDYAFLRAAEKRVHGMIRKRVIQTATREKNQAAQCPAQPLSLTQEELDELQVPWTSQFYGRPWFSDTRQEWINMKGIGLHDMPHASLGTLAERLDLPFTVNEAHQAEPDCITSIHLLALEMSNLHRFTPSNIKVHRIMTGTAPA